MRVRVYRTSDCKYGNLDDAEFRECEHLEEVIDALALENSQESEGMEFVVCKTARPGFHYDIEIYDDYRE